MHDNTATARRFITALEQLDATPIRDLLADDVVQVLPLAASGSTDPAATFDGRARVMDVQTTIVSSFAAVAFTGATYTESADGQTVFVESVGRRRHRGTGEVYENVYLLKFEFRDGLISRITEYSNPVAFARFFGRPLGPDR